MGHSLVIYQATTVTNSTGDWSSNPTANIVFNGTESGLVDKVFYIGEGVRYLWFMPYGDYAFDIDAVTYSCIICPDPLLPPSVTIASSDADNSICAGTSVSFTATPGNTGEGTVSYQCNNR
jgi:hypothetical protein